MTEISDNDIDRIAAAIAPKLVQHVREEHHDFWIDPEAHYQDHAIKLKRLSDALDIDTLAGLKELGQLHSSAKRNAFKMVLWLLLVVSVLSAALYGIFVHKPPSVG